MFWHILQDIVLDIRRAVFLVRTIFSASAGPLVRHLLRLTPSDTSDVGVRIRVTIEKLGLTYLKLGQFLAMRFDILPAEVCRELNKLFESVPPMPEETVRHIIEVELGGPLETFFTQFNIEPIGSASVAQAHQAYTYAHGCVAVKVQRPGIRRIFMSDWRNIRRMARMADLFGLLGKLSVREMVEEFGVWTLREMDFTVEGRTADQLRISAMPYEVVPEVFWDMTTSKLLTMEFFDALSLAQLISLIEAGDTEQIHAHLPQLDILQVLHNMTFASLRQLFVTGFYHGDPHPGNILILNDNSVVFIDFGIFGELTEYERETLIGQIENIALGNTYQSYRYYLRQLTPTEDTDLNRFQWECLAIMRQWYESSINPEATIAERHLSKYAGDMLDLARRHKLRFGANYLLYWRALNSLSASTIRIPNFELMAELRAFFEQLRPSPSQRIQELFSDERHAVVFADVFSGLPNRSAHFLDRVIDREEWTVYRQESPRQQHWKNQHTRWLQAGVFAVSLAALCIVIRQLDSWVRLPIISLTVLSLIVPVKSMVKRRHG